MSYHEFNAMRKLVCKEEKKEKNNNVFADKVYTDMHIPETCFSEEITQKIKQELITQKRKQADAMRWLHDRYLSNDELMQKIREQLSYEKMIRQLQQCGPSVSWEKLLRTKLFNNPRI